MPPAQTANETATHDDVTAVFGSIADSIVAKILATGATRADLDAVVAWISGETETLSEAGHPLSGTAAAVYEILNVSGALAGRQPEEYERRG